MLLNSIYNHTSCSRIVRHFCPICFFSQLWCKMYTFCFLLHWNSILKKELFSKCPVLVFCLNSRICSTAQAKAKSKTIQHFLKSFWNSWAMSIAIEWKEFQFESESRIETSHLMCHTKLLNVSIFTRNGSQCVSQIIMFSLKIEIVFSKHLVDIE